MNPIWIAQISDLHVTPPGAGTDYSGDTGPALERCVAAIAAADPAPKAVVASGDLANAGAPEEYARLRSLLAPLAMPVYLMPGNHDDRDVLRHALAGHDYLPVSGPLAYETGVGPLRLLMLDSVIPGDDAGMLDAGQLEWLQRRLECRGETPTVIFMHHPPTATGMERMDRIGLDAASSATLGEIVRAHAGVLRIACGHVHRAACTQWAGTVLAIAPSTAFQAEADFRRPGEFTATQEAPAYLAHWWGGNELVTHMVSVPAISGRGEH